MTETGGEAERRQTALNRVCGENERDWGVGVGGIRRIYTGSDFSVVRSENEKEWRIRIDTGRISAWFTVTVKETRGP